MSECKKCGKIHGMGIEDKDTQECEPKERGVDTSLKPIWIDVKDRLPKEYERVLIVCEEGICSGKRIDYTWCCDPLQSYASDGCVFHVTHWMPLPKYPKI